MSRIFVEALKGCEYFHSLQGVSDDEIREAQVKLGVSFAPEYYEYLKAYGIASIKAHEFTGLGSSKRLNVVDNTMQERELHPGKLDNLYVVEQSNIDGVIILQSPDSNVYLLDPSENINLICDSLAKYIKISNE